MINNKFFLILLGVIILLITAVYFNKDEIVSQLNKYNLLPQEENLTELYFEDHLLLPNKVQPYKNYSFKFTAHNLENKDFTYDYDIRLAASDSTRILDEGSFTLKNKGYKTIKHTINPKEINSKTKISVNLNNKNQSIHFWIEPVENIK